MRRMMEAEGDTSLLLKSVERLNSSVTWSYDKHVDHERQATKLPSCYANPTSVDAWRHRRMLDSVRPLTTEFPGSRWMTVGDGNFGSDAYFLERTGVKAVATSISDSTLALAKAQGLIQEFRVENAENISAPDASYDFVLCKESYHHFPRPSVAFYEMLRVAKTAVVLIEPSEGPVRLLDYLKIFVKTTIRNDESVLFETSGNFIYRLNIREVEKMATALNLGCVAYRPFNDFYHPRLSGQGFGTLSVATLLTKFGLAIQNILCDLRLMNYGLTTVMVFKSLPSDDLRKKLKKAGFRLTILAKNPYS